MQRAPKQSSCEPMSAFRSRSQGPSYQPPVPRAGRPGSPLDPRRQAPVFVPPIRASFRSRSSLANLTAGFFLFKKSRKPNPLHPFRPFTLLLLLSVAAPASARGQLLFDWPVRSQVQPEAVLSGAEAIFWNPGALAPSADTQQEFWLTHIDGPDATGVRGLALAGTVDLPAGLRAALGYWHLGIPDIPITTDSPAQDFGTLEVAEDVMVAGLARNGSRGLGVGGTLRVQRGSAGGESRTNLAGRVGMNLSTNLPLSPRLGLALGALGQEVRVLAGMEVSLPSLARARIPVHLAYGFQRQRGAGPTEHRLSLRGSWKEQIHFGAGLSHQGKEEGWTPLWTLGIELGRYGFSVLREALPNGFGPVHFYRASIRFPTDPPG